MQDFTRRAFIGAAVSLLVLPAEARGLISGRVDRIQVRKAQRQLDLVGQGRVLKSYEIRLGARPVGPKRFQSDMRTPEGAYRIDRRNPRSAFHLSLGVSYPTPEDRAYAASRGRAPGGEIFIHGQPNGHRGTIRRDWTRGCIAVSNADMDEIWRLVPVGCPIHIHA
ncbi:L,D-transpeptidase family protein [Defluviimonas salinarum]|uniref:L,D-transpeptidase family protein n=1 Tax=Defluviimonas salinarum TaxID=2992147 RepID=A0ABT3J9T0_9RHOB|nr:L,D-transpeptidase family protein [Defluviimonas salinarum]MCW3784425.1 L,D-transpeptidase family protein [Defluviimonas salinarum]